VYCLDVYLAQETSTERQIQAIVDVLWTWQVPLLGIETNGFQSLLPNLIREAIAKRAADEGVPWSVTLVAVVNTANKILRITSLEAGIVNHWTQFSQRLDPVALQQMAEFIPVEGSGKMDFPDSLEGGIKVLNHLYERRDIV
jgi:hypothetical protein